MNRFRYTLFALIASALCAQAIHAQNLWYTSPAWEWMQALPVGNGRLGAMVWGRTDIERLSIGESSMWSGNYDPHMNPAFGKTATDTLRALFLEGRIAEGNTVAWNRLHGFEHTFGSHVPMGDFTLTLGHEPDEVTRYRRRLALDSAICTVSYRYHGVNYTREYFCSNPAQVMVIRLKADQPKALSLTLGADLLRPEAYTYARDNTLCIRGRATQPGRVQGGVNFLCRALIKSPDGKITANDTTLSVTDASEATLYIDLRTDYRCKDYESLAEMAVSLAARQRYRQLRARHIQDFSSLFNRVQLQLGASSLDTIPTDQRWQAIKHGADDPYLQSLFFQYGRYLTIASSRDNSPLPIALQGFFNDNLACNMGWNNDYHLDINTEQNYWLTGPGNLSECDAPLHRYIAHLAEYGQTTASTTYGCRGWTAHTVANIWGFTAPSGCIAWGLFPTAGSWIATHLWTHYLYTGDLAFLRNEAYPLLKGNALFLMDYFTLNPQTGLLMSGPSISPENGFHYQGANHCACLTPTVDHVLAREIFSDCIHAAALLDTDALFADTLRQKIALLPPLQVNRYGGIREWGDDYEEAYPNHRHMSHLLALYPFHQISMQHTPQLAEAAASTINRRLQADGWEDVEWSRANAVCFYARLKQPSLAYQSINQLIGGLSRENLFTISPKGIAGAPWDIFAIDGNTAGGAGIAEMLVQAEPLGDQTCVYLLPCLPAQWASGSFCGLCVPGLEVSAAWDNGRLLSASAKCRVAGTYRFLLPDGTAKEAQLQTGEVFRITQ